MCLCTGSVETAAIVAHPATYSTAITGQSVQMTCVAYGYPIPNVTWKDVTHDLDLSDKVIQNTHVVSANGTVFVVSVLQLCSVTMAQNAEYSCSADNGLTGPAIANQSASFLLTVSRPLTGELS